MKILGNEAYADLKAQVARLTEQNTQLERSRDGWESDALNYARSRGCQEQLTDAAKAEVARLTEALATSRADALETPENVERLAREAHAAWSGWMTYLFGKCTRHGTELIIPAWAVERWERQSRTAYADLPEEEKASDRDEARRYIRALQEDHDE